MDGVMHVLFLCFLSGAMIGVNSEDPYLFFTWKITYGTLSPLGIPQQVILINDQFPGPLINSTTNNNIVVNVFNNLDEPFLLTWSGIQQRKNSWQEGVLGTNCPIQPGTNYTYHFQVKDQIGSFMYYPSTALHRAAGAFGGLNINSRLLIPVPYPDPEDDYTVIINDWYTKSHKALRSFLDSGRSLGRPDAVLINGKTAKGDGKDEPLFTMKPGKTYKYRICNAGLKTSINFRIQGHTMKLVEMEGSHVIQNVYESLDVHVGQCLTVLVTADQAPRDYYIVASTRFIKTILTDKVFKYDTIQDDPPAKIRKVITQPNVVNMTHRNFVEIIFENHEKSIESWHLDGYSFFAVAVEAGTWSPEKRKNYNLLDAVSRTTVQVFPKSWAAILLTFDNCGMWNLRSEMWERTYLGQQLYASVLSPARSLRDEYNVPDNAMLCGLVKGLPKPPPYTI
ncbi:hypothetical protein JCGZ_16211 [Jatropha curcas]|uniref:Uncharacterized protein n=1 Tax=Jatropha curcas TaxID=180498 RepID=A0A067K347_JATCU|nr:hypothetical protein JCGZ_16211 [Jatropha curcas]